MLIKSWQFSGAGAVPPEPPGGGGPDLSGAITTFLAVGVGSTASTPVAHSVTGAVWEDTTGIDSGYDNYQILFDQLLDRVLIVATSSTLTPRCRVYESENGVDYTPYPTDPNDAFASDINDYIAGSAWALYGIIFIGGRGGTGWAVNTVFSDDGGLTWGTVSILNLSLQNALSCRFFAMYGEIEAMVVGRSAVPLNIFLQYNDTGVDPWMLENDLGAGLDMPSSGLLCIQEIAGHSFFGYYKSVLPNKYVIMEALATDQTYTELPIQGMRLACAGWRQSIVQYRFGRLVGVLDNGDFASNTAFDPSDWTTAFEPANWVADGVFPGIAKGVVYSRYLGDCYGMTDDTVNGRWHKRNAGAWDTLSICPKNFVIDPTSMNIVAIR